METEIEQTTATENGSGPEPDPSAEHSPAEIRSPQQLFQFSAYVHVGPGSETCEEGQDGGCADPLHFHAWIRLPNQFQHSSIREKSLAAKARKLRLLRDESSDERAIIDGDLDDLIRREDRDSLIEEIVNKDFLQDHLRAMREAQGDDDEGDFAHIEEDRERLRALEIAPPEDRNEEELEELRKHHQMFNDAVEERRKEIQRPLRESIENEDILKLRELVFEQRATNIAQEEFNRTYSLWEWFISTLKPQPQGIPTNTQLASERVFSDINHLKAAAPEVIEALDQAFTEIEAEAGRAMRGF